MPISFNTKINIKMPNFRDILSKLNPKNRRSNLISREINLVPDVKDEMIKTLKMRNFIFFLCIIVASASIAATLFVGSIAGGQQAVVNGKKSTLEKLSSKVDSYSDLSDFLTIKDQLGNISSITSNKKLLSRTFNIISTLLPTGADTIKISELAINLSSESPTLSFDAQADAGNPPYIDYNVLDSFKKSMQYMRYDYGNYVDKEGETIPAYCMIESGSDGATFYDTDRQSYYAYWLIKGEGCNPSYAPDDDEEEESNATPETPAEDPATKGYTLETYEGQTVVKIWRTPQFATWYKNENLSLDGAIEGVAHFESSCTTYSGYEADDYAANASETVITTKDGITWTSSNDSCLLVPDGTDGISISDSSNGRGADDKLVLRFSAVITLASEVYDFANHHMLAVAPSGRRNVTDSYVQIQNMFSERAADCSPDDPTCSNTTNGGN